MFPGSYYYDDYETPQQEQDKARAEEERRKNKVGFGFRASFALCRECTGWGAGGNGAGSALLSVLPKTVSPAVHGAMHRCRCSLLHALDCVPKDRRAAEDSSSLLSWDTFWTDTHTRFSCATQVLEEQQKARLTAGTPTVVLEAAQQTVLQLGVKVPVAATPMGKQVYGMPQGVVAEVAVRRVGGADGSKQQGGGGGGAGGKKKGGKKGGQQGGGAAGGWRSVPCDVIQAYMGRVNRGEDVVARAWVEGLEAGEGGGGSAC